MRAWSFNEMVEILLKYNNYINSCFYHLKVLGELVNLFINIWYQSKVRYQVWISPCSLYRCALCIDFHLVHCPRVSIVRGPLLSPWGLRELSNLVLNNFSGFKKLSLWFILMGLSSNHVLDHHCTYYELISTTVHHCHLLWTALPHSFQLGLYSYEPRDSFISSPTFFVYINLCS